MQELPPSRRRRRGKGLVIGSKSSSRLDSTQNRPICRARALGGPLPVGEISQDAEDPLVWRRLRFQRIDAKRIPSRQRLSIDDLAAQISSRVDGAAAGGFSPPLRHTTSADMVSSFVGLAADEASPIGQACAAILAMPPADRRAVARLVADATIAALGARR
jgi:hypothetical protein